MLQSTERTNVPLREHEAHALHGRVSRCWMDSREVVSDTPDY
jgi:hypothetical protein